MYPFPWRVQNFVNFQYQRKFSMGLEYKGLLVSNDKYETKVVKSIVKKHLFLQITWNVYETVFNNKILAL